MILGIIGIIGAAVAAIFVYRNNTKTIAPIADKVDEVVSEVKSETAPK
jgi:hypothetical protein